MEKVLFSSDKMDWETPQWLFDKLNSEFHFELDVCASANNHKCPAYINEEQNALIREWSLPFVPVNCWMNPPYGRGIGAWMKKAYEESLKGCVVVCLVPARTDTNWWWKYSLQGYEIRFIKGRLKFGNANNCAPFPSALIIFDNEVKQIETDIGNAFDFEVRNSPKVVWWEVKEK